MLDSSPSHILDFSDYPDWLHSLKNGKNEYILQTYLQQNKHLTYISFFSCGLTDPDIKMILAIVGKCPHIQSLDLANNHFTKEGMIYLAKKLPQMQLLELDVSGNYKVDCDGIHALTRGVKQSTLHTLKLNRIPLHGSCDVIFNELKESRVVHLKMNTAALAPSDAPAIATHIAGWLNVESLDLSSNLLGNDGIDIITREASKLNLRELNVSYNQHTSDILPSLAQKIRDTSLTTVHFEGITLPAAPLAILNSAVLFNEQYNQPAQLSLAAQSGGELKLHEQKMDKELPPEVAEEIGVRTTESNMQKRAFMQGWAEQGQKYKI